MTNLRKFIAAAVGAILLGLSTFLGIGDGGSLFGIPADSLVNSIVAVLTAVGVYVVPNEEA